jgi:hypothetical protein
LECFGGVQCFQENFLKKLCRICHQKNLWTDHGILKSSLAFEFLNFLKCRLISKILPTSPEIVNN